MEQRLMSELEDKEKDLNKLKAKADALLKSNHPASDKIEVKTDPVIRNFRSLLSLNPRPLFSPAGIQGYSADTVELAPADH